MHAGNVDCILPPNWLASYSPPRTLTLVLSSPATSVHHPATKQSHPSNATTRTLNQSAVHLPTTPLSMPALKRSKSLNNRHGGPGNGTGWGNPYGSQVQVMHRSGPGWDGPTHELSKES